MQDFLSELVGIHMGQARPNVRQALNLLLQAVMAGNHFAENINQVIELFEFDAHRTGLFESAFCHIERHNGFFRRYDFCLHRFVAHFATAGTRQTLA
ncbi:hypothetical protein D3C75_529600 [compost metagenome]